MSTEEEIDALVEGLTQYQRQYYSGRPTITDAEYDRLFDRLRALETSHPEHARPDSPTIRVGADLAQDFPEVPHTIPVLSLDKCYAPQEVEAWVGKLQTAIEEPISFILEEKLDGAGIVLYYRDGLLERALTRGNGSVGNDVTGNVRTIASVPLRLAEPMTGAIRGEIFLRKSRFDEVNTQCEVPYANPRNLAAGTLRRKKSTEVAQFPLEIFVYEGYLASEPATHFEILEDLDRLGLRLNPRLGFFTDHHDVDGLRDAHPTWAVGGLDGMAGYIADAVARRDELDYEIDGLVLKVNEIAVRTQLGNTGHHPRWAMAFKFESPVGRTTVRAIDVQVGRTGRVTPVARVEPVSIGGSTISNVTLHNKDYVELLELAVGDSVEVSRRGDVIPAVERVLEKNEKGNTTWQMPGCCPSCGTDLQVIGAHHFCTNANCPDQVRGRFRFFVGRGQMDIENLGPETTDFLLAEGYIRDVQDLYTFDPGQLDGVAGFGDKKIQLIRDGIQKSRSQPYERVLVALGIPELGQKAVELLVGAGYRDIDSLLQVVDGGDPTQLLSIHGMGEKTAAQIVDQLGRPANRERIDALRKAGLQFRSEAPLAPEATTMAEQTWCVTGSFEHFKPRSRATEEIARRGGRITGSVTSKTTHLLAGAAAGSKLTKARELGIAIVTEGEFLRLLES